MSSTTDQSAVVIGPRGDASGLVTAMRLAGVPVVVVTPEELPQRSVSAHPHDVVFVSSDLGPACVDLGEHHRARVGAADAVVVFCEDCDSPPSFAVLESSVAAGYDVLVPPFLPAALRRRMTAYREQSPVERFVVVRETAEPETQFERELNNARDIQAGLLPRKLPHPAGWDLAVRFRPARRVAGDFYDAFAMANGLRCGLVVGDVCDKGAGSGLFMALILTLLRHTTQDAGTRSEVREDVAAQLAAATPGNGSGWPAQYTMGAVPMLAAVESTNSYLTRNHLGQGYFATLFFAVLDPVSGTVLYINGGHNPPIIMRADGSHEMLMPTGPALGMLPDGSFLLGQCRLDHGDSLLAYTDGVVEARGDTSEQFGVPRLLDAMNGAPRSGRGSTAEQALTAIDEALEAFVRGSNPFDDITMLMVCRSDR